MFKEGIKKRLNSTSGMIAITSFSSIGSSILTITSGLLVAKLMLPEELGLFNSFSIFTSYIILSQMGIPNGLAREIPFLFGKKEKTKAHQLAAVAQYFSLVLGISMLIIGFVISFYFLTKLNYEYALGSVIIGITSFQTFYITKYLKVLYRSNADFNKLAVINISISVISLISVLFVWKYGFYGLGIRVIAIAMADLFLSYFWRPIRVVPRWSYVNFKELFVVGAPIFFVSSVYGLWPTIQRTVILILGGAKALGLFALAIIVQNMLSLINSSISGVTFPKMSYVFGEGAKFKELIKIPAKFAVVSFVLFVVIAIVGWFLLPIVIHWLLPNYAEGIYAAQWMLIVALVSVFGVFSSVYVVIRRNMDRLKAYSSGVVVWAFFVYLQYSLYGFDLVIFPKAMVMGYMATALVDAYFYFKYYKISSAKINS